MATRKSFIRTLRAAIATTALFWLIGWLWFSANIFTSYAKPQKNDADAIIVLTGGKNRIETGLVLLKHKVSDEMFISGVNREVKIEDLVKERPIPCCITLGYKANDTVQNGQETHEWVQENNLHKIVVVTSAYHMQRAMTIFRHYMDDTTIIPYPVHGDAIEPTKSLFWKTSFAEYNKTIATWITLSLT